MESNFRYTLSKSVNVALKLKIFLAGKSNKAGLKDKTKQNTSSNKSVGMSYEVNISRPMPSVDSRRHGSI